jgi:antitoxin component HigA of HigAB toxin-antitoxin module
MSIVDRLAVRADLNRDESDYLESLSTLIEQYERQQEPIFTAVRDPIEALKYLMQGRGMNASDLGNLLGNRALGSKVLRRARELSKANVIALARHFCVSPALFLPSPSTVAHSRRPPRAA